MKSFLYPAIFFKVDDEYQVHFPDINLSTDGINMEEAYLYAEEFLRSYFTYVLKFDLDFNYPTDYESIVKKLNRDETCMLVDVTVTEKDIQSYKKRVKD